MEEDTEETERGQLEDDTGGPAPPQPPGTSGAPAPTISLQTVLSYVAETLAGITPFDQAFSFETVAVALVNAGGPRLLYATNSGGRLAMKLSVLEIQLSRDYSDLDSKSAPTKPKDRRKLKAKPQPHEGKPQPKMGERVFQSATRLMSLAAATGCPQDVRFEDWPLIWSVLQLLAKGELHHVPQPRSGIRIHGEMVLADHIVANELRCEPLRAIPIAASKRWCGHCFIALNFLRTVEVLFDFEATTSHHTAGKYWFLPPLFLGKLAKAAEAYFLTHSSGGLAFHWDEGYLACTKETTYAAKEWQIRPLSPLHK